ncbi:fucose mutarotase isoform X2 [Macrotis lagotis]|uniref:fucose mutarotase isoform X2 n=1 Tax=Macrotis lagotis TaxID=92651 RepID=UPI003D691F0C
MVVLKGIPALLSPELLFALAKMGHGDEIVLADANFPTSSICRCGPMEVRADGLSIPQLLESILKLLPLDTYEPNPVVVMDLVESDKAKGLRAPPVWQIYQNLLSQSGCPRGTLPFLEFWASKTSYLTPEPCSHPQPPQQKISGLRIRGGEPGEDGKICFL